MAKVFLSYARQNADRIRRLAERLRSWGHEVWLDELELHAGQRWRDEVSEAVTTSDFFVLALSKSSMQSEFVEWELDLAEETGRTVIPIAFGAPRSDWPLLHRVDALQRISFTKNFERGAAKLVEALGGVRSDLPNLAEIDQYPSVAANARLITGMIRFLQESCMYGGPVIFHSNEQNNYYIQLLVTASQPDVYGEAVGNEYLEEDAKLGEADVAKLIGLGWRNPTRRDRHRNHSREWFANADSGRAMIAGDILRAFHEVYRHPPGEPLTFELLADR